MPSTTGPSTGAATIAVAALRMPNMNIANANMPQTALAKVSPSLDSFS